MINRRDLLAAAISLVAGIEGCAHAPPPGPPPRPHPPEYYDYYYYPDVSVYFHLYSGSYYYREGPRWQRVEVLPGHLHLDRRTRRHLVIRDDPPYRHYREHEEQYRPAPGFKPDTRRDRPERDRNRRIHEDYRRKRR